jgi:hypothetical protein
VPINVFERVKTISQKANLPHNIDGFRIMNGILPPKILEIKQIRKPKSKEVFLQIDTRHIMRL